MVNQSFEPYVLPPFGKRPSWASDYGRDEFGTFADLKIGEATQRMRFIPTGTFMMGSPEDEPHRKDEEMQVLVTFTSSFWISDTPVTHNLWGQGLRMGQGLRIPIKTKNKEVPVERDMNHIYDFFTRVREYFQDPFFRLPSSEEWEYACRARTTESTYAEAMGCELGDIAWHRDNCDWAMPVKQKIPNPWGLYDMLGNVREFCGSFSFRGGGWVDPPEDIRSANFHGYCSILGGFRIVYNTSNAPPISSYM